MFSKLYKFSKFVMYLNSCSMDLGREREREREREKRRGTQEERVTERRERK